MDEFKRVRYEKSPLIEVIYQLRFPTILSINTTQPAEFQDRIREKYPFFQEGIDEQNEIVIGLNPEQATLKRSQNKNYSFISADNKYKVNLTSSFLAISTKGYTQWEEFVERTKEVVAVFEEVYKPSFYTRIGLRYIDVIIREQLGLTECKWNELIKPHILGLLTEDVEDGINSFSTEAEYKNEHGIFNKVHVELVHVNNSPTLSLLLDCDYSVKTITQKSDVADISEKLHSASSNFIIKAITDKLNNAMEPVEI